MENQTSPDNCPEGCKHVSFHYCAQSGTHCSEHCTCTCDLCREGIKGITIVDEGKDTGGRWLSGTIATGSIFVANLRI